MLHGRFILIYIKEHLILCKLWGLITK